MRVAVPTERAVGETRVAITPAAAGRLITAGAEIVVESGAGASAAFSDAEYSDAGATIAPNAGSLFTGADVVVQVVGPRPDVAVDIDRLPEGIVLISFLKPGGQPEVLSALAERGVTALAMELMPRTTVAQRMDALSAMATVAGYSAVLHGAVAMNKFLPMLTTAAGTIAPANVYVIGAGVAGLQAIATARRLGGVVEAFDIRPVAKEQVESLGARFVEWEAEEAADLETEGGYAAEVTADEQEQEQQLLAKHVAGADLVITTAAVPGRAAPRLISADMVAAMRPGSVIVDLAAATGGNCELTVVGENVERDGVKILGALDLATALPVHASEMYSRTVSALLKHLAPEGDLTIDLEDEITAATCVTHDGCVRT